MPQEQQAYSDTVPTCESRCMTCKNKQELTKTTVTPAALIVGHVMAVRLLSKLPRVVCACKKDRVRSKSNRRNGTSLHGAKRQLHHTCHAAAVETCPQVAADVGWQPKSSVDRASAACVHKPHLGSCSALLERRSRLWRQWARHMVTC